MAINCFSRWQLGEDVSIESEVFQDKKGLYGEVLCPKAPCVNHKIKVRKGGKYNSWNPANVNQHFSAVHSEDANPLKDYAQLTRKRSKRKLIVKKFLFL